MFEGILIVNKEKHWTSFDVVNKLKRITGNKKIGHAGTLDPLATGVLVVAVSRKYTKQLTQLIKKDKTYVVDVFLGAYSKTDDEEGEKTQIKVEKIPSTKEISLQLKKFIGDITQIPPQFSAVKIKGKAAYTYARQGKELTLKERNVHIFSIKIINYAWPILTLEVKTGSGVYIRSLARDLGAALHTGGYVKELCRTQVGDYSLSDAKSLEELSREFANIT